jgi:hypothetical protein
MEHRMDSGRRIESYGIATQDLLDGVFCVLLVKLLIRTVRGDVL